MLFRSRIPFRIRRCSSRRSSSSVGSRMMGCIIIIVRMMKIGRASCRERGVDLGGRRIIKKKKEISATFGRLLQSL